MAIDLNKIREQLDRLSGQGKQQNSDLWGPADNEPASVRIIPWPDGNNGDPFKERWFYYGVGRGRGIPCPFQWKKPDPINELRQKLRDENTKESFELREKFKPSRRIYAPVLVRGKEDEGIKVWGFSKTVAKALYEEIMDEEVGDITDPVTGYDIRITKEKGEGQWPTTKVKTARKSTVLIAPDDNTKAAKATASARTDELLSNVPDLDEIFPQQEYDVIEKRMNDYINADEQNESDGTETTAKSDTAKSDTTKSDSSNGSEKTTDASDKVTEKEFGDMDSAFAELGDMVEAES